MNKKLQKFILNFIKVNKGEAKKKDIFNKTNRGYFKEEKQLPKTNIITQHQLDLLEKEDKVIRKDQLADTPYILAPLGYQEFDSYWKKSWRFILYDKNNLFILFSLLISIIALLISILYK